MLRHAFTIVELLVVISIIALLSSMISVIPTTENPEEQIELAAASVVSAVKQARKLALETKNTHALTFHIENSGDSSVLKNFSQTYDGVPNGRHWLAVIGPDRGFLSKSKNEPPIPNGYPHLQSYTRMVEISMVNKIYLPPGTRFLAIGDSDNGNSSGARDYWKGDKGPGHPRPWFGYYDNSTNTLYPWGGYDPDQDATFRSADSDIRSCTTGLLFEGSDREIPYDADLDVCVNPAPTHGILFPHAGRRHLGASGTVDNGQKPEATRVGKPRAILDGRDMEYAIVFTGNGDLKLYQGVRKKFYEPKWGTDQYRATFSIGHNSAQTGGYYITVARDIDPEEDIYPEVNPKTGQPDYTKFNSVEDAFKSISPFRRIFIQRDTGATVVRHPFHPDAYLEAKHMLQHDPYPSKTIPEY